MYEYFRHRSLNGNTRIQEDLSRPKGGYRADNYGGSIGGPIFRDRHFFFVSFDGQRFTQEQTVFLNVPDGPAPTGAAAVALSRLEPLAGDWDLHRRQNVARARTDHNLTAKHKLSLRFNHETFWDRDLSAKARSSPARLPRPVTSP